MKLEIRAIGKMRGPLADLGAEYHKRIGKNLTIREYEAPKGLSGAALYAKEATFLLGDLPAERVVRVHEVRRVDRLPRSEHEPGPPVGL
ncbi:MAG: hypothetical protein ABL897_15920, partial [Hyphomicrobium sp.]